MKTITRVFVFALLAFSGIVDAATYRVTPADSSWITRIKTLQAGDTMTFTAGTYTITGKFQVSFAGTAAAPIVVQGEDGAVIQRNGADQNLMDIATGSHFTIQNLDFVGGSKGLRFGETGPISNAIIKDNKIHGTATTAVTFNDGGKRYTNIQFIGNEIYDTGSQESECLYMGCNQNQCTASDCLIEGNFCHDTLDATSGSLGSGIQVKTGSYNNIIRNNVCVDVKGPGVLIYDDYDQGKNLVQGNFIWRSGDNAIQATAGSTIVNNVIIDAAGSAIAIIANQVQSGKQIRNVDIAHNTILNGRGISIASSSLGSTFSVINNAVFSTTGQPLNLNLNGVNNKGNGINGGTAGNGNIPVGTPTTELLSGSNTNPNFYPAAGSALIAAGDASGVALAQNVDFNANKRATTPTIGAYEYAGATNPGWALAKAFKTFNAAPTTPTTKETTAPTTPTVTPTTQTPTTKETTAPTVPTETGEVVPLQAIVTVTLKTAPSSLQVQYFASDVASVLDIPPAAITNIAVDLDASTDTTTVVHFVLNNSLRPDGTRVDPIAAAYKLREMANTKDPALAGTMYLANMEVNSVEEQQVESADSDFVGSSTFIIIIAVVGGVVLIAAAVTITAIVLRRRRNGFF